MRSPQYGHPAHQEAASGYGPCRHCLRTFLPAQEDRLLFTYQPIQESGGLPAPGPIFVHAGHCERYDQPELPPDLAGLPLVIEGYRRGGFLLLQSQVGAESAQTVVAQVLAGVGVDYAHVRNAEAGCFIARVERDATVRRSAAA
ncbi:MAG: DUF1203 domain-containing protein [Gemmatimonadales bacterium]|jgi:hypothetical protein|nr:MAG: DUF1203 domain-containing protein [Gemmatimonadales bacterium]